GAMWQLNGTGRAADWSLPGGNPASPSGTPLGQNLGWIFGDQNVHVKDKENWFQIDGDYSLPSGLLTLIKFGARYQDHSRVSAGVIGQGPACRDAAGNLVGLDFSPAGVFNCPPGAQSPF